MSKELKFYKEDGDVFVHMHEGNKEEVIALINDIAPGVNWRNGNELTTDRNTLYGFYDSERMVVSDLLVQTYRFGFTTGYPEVVLMGDPAHRYENLEPATYDEFVKDIVDFADGIVLKEKVNDKPMVGDRVDVTEHAGGELVHGITGLGKVLNYDESDNTYMILFDNGGKQWVQGKYVNLIPNKLKVGDKVQVDKFDSSIEPGPRHFIAKSHLATITGFRDTEYGKILEVDFTDGLSQIVHPRFVEKLMAFDTEGGI